MQILKFFQKVSGLKRSIKNMWQHGDKNIIRNKQKADSVVATPPGFFSIQNLKPVEYGGPAQPGLCHSRYQPGVTLPQYQCFLSEVLSF